MNGSNGNHLERIHEIRKTIRLPCGNARIVEAVITVGGDRPVVSTGVAVGVREGRPRLDRRATRPCQEAPIRQQVLVDFQIAALKVRLMLSVKLICVDAASCTLVLEDVPLEQIDRRNLLRCLTRGRTDLGERGRAHPATAVDLYRVERLCGGECRRRVSRVNNLGQIHVSVRGRVRRRAVDGSVDDAGGRKGQLHPGASGEPATGVCSAASNVGDTKRVRVHAGKRKASVVLRDEVYPLCVLIEPSEGTHVLAHPVVDIGTRHPLRHTAVGQIGIRRVCARPVLDVTHYSMSCVRVAPHTTYDRTQKSLASVRRATPVNFVVRPIGAEGV